MSCKKYNIPENALKKIKTYYKLHPIWSFKDSDSNVLEWDFIKNADVKVLEELKSYESMTGGEIIEASGGRKNGTNNHPVNILELSNKAKKEITKIKSISKDLQLLFSLRLATKVRLYGIIDEKSGLFKIIWLDKKHEIYPVKK